MRILLAEDEENIREGIKLNLELEGYEVEIAKDGKEAIKKFKEQHFDLLLLDIMLPEVDGYQICEQVRLTNLEIPITPINFIISEAHNVHSKPLH